MIFNPLFELMLFNSDKKLLYSQFYYLVNYFTISVKLRRYRKNLEKDIVKNYQL